jgi:hypothetical protein
VTLAELPIPIELLKPLSEMPAAILVIVSGLLMVRIIAAPIRTALDGFTAEMHAFRAEFTTACRELRDAISKRDEQ